MNFFSKFVIVFICVLTFTNSQGQASYYLKQEITHKAINEGNKGDVTTYFEVFYFDAHSLVFISKEKRIVIKSDAKEILIIDEKNKTYLTTSIPYEPLNILTDVSSLRFLEDKKIKGILEKNETGRHISGFNCSEYSLSLDTRYPQLIKLWTTTDINVTEQMQNSLKYFWMVKHYNCDDTVITGLSNMNGFVLEYDITEKHRNETHITKAVCVEFSEKEIPQEVLTITAEYHLKDKITYNDLVNETLGEESRTYNSEELAVLNIIDKFREGYQRRDVEYVDEWVEELFAKDAFVLGTDAPWPDTWEWRGGHEAAKEMFARDWRRWGNVKIFNDETFVNVDGDAAWIVAFAVVNMYRDDDDRSRQRSLSRIDEYIKEKSWTSRRAIYEIIADASSVLAQYERGFNFVTPMRTEFGLVKRDGKWLLKMVHFSHPARGFRSFRLLHSDPNLLEY